jgi:tRNA G37 N-methylase Trm5
MKTAVEYIQDNLSMNKTLGEIKIITATAKEMERQQIIEAYASGVLNECSGANIRSEQYYEQTFKSE